MGEEVPLCPDCQKLGHCQFETVANEIAASVPEGTGIEKALKAHQAISDARTRAREELCPHVNRVDPDYPGKRLL